MPSPPRYLLGRACPLARQGPHRPSLRRHAFPRRREVCPPPPFEAVGQRHRTRKRGSLRIVRRLVALLVLLVGGPCLRAGADPAVELTADEKALFAWWDTLGYPDVTHLPLGQIPSTEEVVGPGEVEFAFLLAEVDGTREAFTTRLGRVRLKTTPSEEDPIAYVENGLAALHKAALIQGGKRADPFHVARTDPGGPKAGRVACSS